MLQIIGYRGEPAKAIAMTSVKYLNARIRAFISNHEVPNYSEFLVSIRGRAKVVNS